MINININDPRVYEEQGIERVHFGGKHDNRERFEEMLRTYDFPVEDTIRYLRNNGVAFESENHPCFVCLSLIWIPFIYVCDEYYLAVHLMKENEIETYFLSKRLNKMVFCEDNGSLLPYWNENFKSIDEDGLVHYFAYENPISECFQCSVELRNFGCFSCFDISNVDDEFPYDMDACECDRRYEEWENECCEEAENDFLGEYHSAREKGFILLSCLGESNVPFFGVEIETYQDPDDCEWIYEEYGDLFSCEKDRSLNPHYGIEMVSQPMTWKYWLSIKESISELFSSIYEGDCTLPEGNNESYGLHVHVSRSAFVNSTALHYANILVNAFSKQCEVIARRADNHSSKDVLHAGDHYDGFYYHYNKLGKLERITLKDYVLPGTRYASVNNTNEDTVEFRIFKTTLDLVVLYGTLEFVKNILEMANSLAMENSGNKYAKFYHIRRVSFNDLLQGDYINAYVEKYKYKEDALTESLLSMTADLNGYFCPVVREEKKAKLLSIEVEGEKKSVLEDYDDLKFEHNFKCEDFSIKDYKKVRNLDCFYEKNEKTLVSAEQISRIKRRLQRKTEGSDPMTAAYQKLFGNVALA